MEILRELREGKGWNMAQAAAALGMKYTTYVSYEKGDRQLHSEQLIVIARCYGVTLDQLLGRSERPSIQYSYILDKYAKLDDFGKRAVNAVLDAELERCEKVIDFGTIRKYLSRPAAGVNGLVEGEDYEDMPRDAKTPPEADFALVVSGDSMEPYLHDGQVVFVDEKAELKPLEVGVFCVDGATYVKQYAPLYDGSLMLLSANPAREDANIRIAKDSGQSVQYFGKVILKKKLPKPIYK